eukprot:CAMPEP_0172494960 /NCGR_PEP_ID=MMETSP1066-20121228/59859_1 /TAXON_ID=671091 /ORGANISM="Coscinodiscus wailesii, Strain CCMP2513" /LENGTH=70 /DNA_ID=CAMNT_0013266317 /DNA_START=164 /DNA_END=376 /DNA_ORIENTATION=+
MATPTTFWRLAGMSYVQYVTRASSAVRNAAKEPAKSKLAANSKFSYNASVWEGGVQGKKVEIDVLSKAGI